MKTRQGSKRTELKGRRSLRSRLFRLTVVSLFGVLLLTTALVLPWRWLAPPTTAFIMRARISGASPIHYSWTQRSDISPNLAIAAVAAEDQKFPTHRGFDLDQIADALRERGEGRTRGASTISQQVAKNLYLWPGQSFLRKGIEAYLTVWIETLWGKERILEVYLNVAQFGPGVFGVAPASRQAFGKPPSTLTMREAAILVAVLPSPERMSITNPSEYVLDRAQEITSAVDALGGVAYVSGF